MASHHVPTAVNDWLGRHHGVVTRARALSLGLTERRIESLVAAGALRPAERGVYVAAAAPPTATQALLAAVAAGGRGAAASHLSAAWLLRLADAAPPQPWVTLPHARRRRLHHARVHRSRDIPATIVDGVPCTTVARTLVDCAAVADRSLVGLLVDRALTGARPAGATRPPARVALADVWAEVAGDPRRPGAQALAAHLAADRYQQPPPASALELLHLGVIERAGLPAPVREHPVAVDGRTYRLDTAFPELRLASEVDGLAYHSTPRQVAADAERRNAIGGAGWRVLVFTWWDVVHRPAHVAEALRRAYDADPA